jgi:hypothetical protein
VAGRSTGRCKSCGLLDNWCAPRRPHWRSVGHLGELTGELSLSKIFACSCAAAIRDCSSPPSVACSDACRKTCTCCFPGDRNLAAEVCAIHSSLKSMPVLLDTLHLPKLLHATVMPRQRARRQSSRPLHPTVDPCLASPHSQPATTTCNSNLTL